PVVPRLTSSRPYWANAVEAVPSETLPDFSSICRARTTTEWISILKKRRAAARVSEKPKSSAPNVANSFGTYWRIWSGSIDVKSVVATIGPSVSAITLVMYGIRGSASGFVSRSRSAATASRRSSFQLVTDQTSAETPQSLANTSAASITHGSETPEPNRLTFGPPMSDLE